MFKLFFITMVVVIIFTTSVYAEHGSDHVTVNEILSIVDYIINPVGSSLNPAEQKFCDGRIGVIDAFSHNKALINRQTAEQQCTLCGNGRIDPGEQCDGGAGLSDIACGSYGFSGGSLSCSNCAIDTSQCQTRFRTTGEQKLLVVMMHFGTLDLNSFNQNMRDNIALLDPYLEDVSYGRFQLTTTFTGPHLISLLGCDSTRGSTDNNERYIQTAINLASQDPNVGNLNQYNRIMIVVDPRGPDNSPFSTICGARGGGSGEILNGVYLYTGSNVAPTDVSSGLTFVGWTFPPETYQVFHEFSHSIGEILPHHSNLLCRDNNQNRVILDSNAQNCIWNSNLGTAKLDPVSGRDILGGNTFGHPVARSKERLRWLLPSQMVTTINGQYTLTPLEINDNGLKLIKIPRSKITGFAPGFYYLEFRQPIGYDVDISYPDNFPLEHKAPFLNGIFISLNDLYFGAEDRLLDPPPYPNPNNFDNLNKAIPVGQLVTLPEGITITVNSVSPQGAQVSIRKN